jgi:DNA-binding CsgD family transcriptional regulator/catechol 2,3-dioxygenase-like lactoylglutathione lyase family enzyme
MAEKRKKGRPPHPDVLTPAEWRVADAVRHGMTNPVIAKRLGVSLDAVKFHISNTLAKLGFTKRSQLRQWNGVSVDSHLHSASNLKPAAVTIGAIEQISRSVADVDAAVLWYRDILGLSHLLSVPNMAFFDCDGTRLMLTQGDGSANSILYFGVTDIRFAHRVLQERGANFIASPHMIHRHPDGTEEWMAFFNDNEGRPLAIMERVPPKQPIGENTDG